MNPDLYRNKVQIDPLNDGANRFSVAAHSLATYAAGGPSKLHNLEERVRSELKAVKLIKRDLGVESIVYHNVELTTVPFDVLSNNDAGITIHLDRNQLEDDEIEHVKNHLETVIGNAKYLLDMLHENHTPE